jgi:phosphatidate cytidylyltransferase
VLAVVVLAPGWLFSAFIALVGAIGLYEVATMTDAHRPLPILVLIAAGAAPMASILYEGRGSFIVAASVIAAMLALVVQVGIVGAHGEEKGTALTLLGALYVGVLFPCFALIRNRVRGINLLILTLLLVIASDTGAYFAGSYLGRIKLLPNVSPKKTVEGAIGGLAATIAAGWILRGPLVPYWTVQITILNAAAIGIISQLGDLACSAYKRSAGVKDSGWIFPGHGGLIDRVSSLVFAAVFAYYYTR